MENDAMTIDEYIQARKRELDDMAAHFKEMNARDPEVWPLSMEGEEEWFEQELAYIEGPEFS